MIERGLVSPRCLGEFRAVRPPHSAGTVPMVGVMRSCRIRLVRHTLAAPACVSTPIRWGRSSQTHCTLLGLGEFCGSKPKLDGTATSKVGPCGPSHLQPPAKAGVALARRRLQSGRYAPIAASVGCLFNCHRAERSVRYTPAVIICQNVNLAKLPRDTHFPAPRPFRSS
jgi:hypothetical protein